MPTADTIAAVATAYGRAGIGVVRVSGPETQQLGVALMGRVPTKRQATLSEFRDADGVVIDRGIALFFPAPRSYTGEDVLEIQAHGGVALLRMLLRRCVELGARVAEPGEFTKRAFLNDKMDLAQAESVADLIDASSTDAVRSAQRSLAGEFSQQISGIREQLIEVRALFEAVLDFPEEEVELIDRYGVVQKLDLLRDNLSTLSESATQGNLLREGVQVVLTGAPNVGKSSLMNRLAEEEVAIVTEVPGTTRDVLRRELVVSGLPVHVIDTAGLRESDDPVERIGVERSLRQVGQADIVLEVREAVNPTAVATDEVPIELGEGTNKILIINKIDLVGEAPRTAVEDGCETVWLSAKTGAGLDELRQTLLRASGREVTDEVPFMARERHIACLRRALGHVNRARDEIDRLELCAEELRLAQRDLDEITGEFSADDLLGEIFSRFCIGK
ncbi:MAG: tRNA uridine-5-carboxymethylaminomethyl(34) synthesis GTPase MnmE [Betaproteobacteria bacterium]|nr:MAG: tRNA uridine-5-carboxymethylaminomethyl(34) synthesis GTPase MnmE [Betaproteobacteria bacterium]